MYESTLRHGLGEELHGAGWIEQEADLASIPAGDLRGTLRALLVIILMLIVVGWFRHIDGRNLIHLLSTVALSLASSPRQWLMGVASPWLRRRHAARLRLPLHAKPLRILDTGPDNDAEVAILHGAADRIVPPSQ